MEWPAALIQGIASSTKGSRSPTDTSSQPFPSLHADPLSCLSALSPSPGRDNLYYYSVFICLFFLLFPFLLQAFNQIACLQKVNSSFTIAPQSVTPLFTVTLLEDSLLTLSLTSRRLILLHNLTLDCLSARPYPL
jgi:hypothetical protein